MSAAEPFEDRRHRLLHLTDIRIAASGQCFGNAVCREENHRAWPRRRRQRLDGGPYPPRKSIEIAGVEMPRADDLDLQGRSEALPKRFQFGKTRSGCGAALLRIERQGQGPGFSPRGQAGQYFRRAGRCVSHHHLHLRRLVPAAGGLRAQRLGLAERRAQQRRAAADRRVGAPHLARANRGDEPREKWPQHGAARQVEEHTVGEEVAQERAHLIEGRRTTHVQEENRRHPFPSPLCPCGVR